MKAMKAMKATKVMTANTHEGNESDEGNEGDESNEKASVHCWQRKVGQIHGLEWKTQTHRGRFEGVGSHEEQAW